MVLFMWEWNIASHSEGKTEIEVDYLQHLIGTSILSSTVRMANVQVNYGALES
jgi:hypothetical protein